MRRGLARRWKLVVDRQQPRRDPRGPVDVQKEAPEVRGRRSIERHRLDCLDLADRNAVLPLRSVAIDRIALRSPVALENHEPLRPASVAVVGRVEEDPPLPPVSRP
jgi:hypothetical protein